MPRKYKQQYTRISSHQREQIVKLFTEEHLSATKVAKRTGHNLSSVKAIYRVFKKEGRIARKTKRDIVNSQTHQIIVFEYDETLSLREALKVESTQVCQFEKQHDQVPIPEEILNIMRKYDVLKSEKNLTNDFELMEHTHRTNPTLARELRIYFNSSKQEIFQFQLDELNRQIKQFK